MATQAHCAYCFESLSASLEKRQPLNLRQVEELWSKYDASDVEEQGEQDEVMDDAPGDQMYKPAAISRLLGPSPSSSSSSSIPSTASSSAPTEASSNTSKASSSRSSLFSRMRRLGAQANSATEDHPLFVTWNTLTKSGGKSLRGCIGTFEAQKLDDGLRNYALTSAFDDARFMPVTLRELSSLECGVTLLTDFEPAPSPMDWEIGTHGLRISFTSHGRRFGATYLPDVAREQGWTKEETLMSLMRKAGWSGKKEEWRKVGDLQVVRYQGYKSTLDYGTWKEWRDWAEAQDGVGSAKPLN